MDKRPAKRRPLLHTPGKLPGKMMLKTGKTDESEQITRLGLVISTLPPKPIAMRMHYFERQHHVGEGRALWQQCRVLKGHARDAQRCRHFPAADYRCPAVRRP